MAVHHKGHDYAKLQQFGIAEILSQNGVDDELLMLLFTFAAHEYLAIIRNSEIHGKVRELSVGSLFAFACRTLSWLGLVEEPDSMGWVHTERLRRLVNKNLQRWKKKYSSLDFDWKEDEEGFSMPYDNIWKKMLEYFEQNPEVLPLIHHGKRD